MGLFVEAELGKLAGIEDDVKVKADDAQFTNPGEVQEFVEKPVLSDAGLQKLFKFTAGYLKKDGRLLFYA